MDIAAIKAKLDIEQLVRSKVTLEKKGNRLLGLCPFHDDHNPSFEIDPTTQRYKCWACKEAGDVIDWIEKTQNLSKSEAIEAAKKLAGIDDTANKKTTTKRSFDWSRASKIFYYTDKSGKVLYEVGRIDLPNGKKEFAQRSPKEDGNGYHYYIPTSFKRVPYRLPELIEAIRSGTKIYLVEGEKSADALNDYIIRERMLGQIDGSDGAEDGFATAVAQGSGGWKPEYAEYFKGADVTIIRDRDLAGASLSADMYKAILPLAKSVQIAESASQDDSEKPLEKHDIVEHLAENLKLSELKQVPAPPLDPLEKPSEKPLGGWQLTDMGNADRLIEARREDLRYVCDRGCWHYWDGTRWKEDRKGRTTEYAKEVVRHIYAEAATAKDEDKQKAIVKHAISSQSSRAITAMIALARSAPSIAIMPDELDTDHWLINIENGVLDLRTRELRPHDPKLNISKLAPVRYDKNAPCPMWESYLDYCLNGDKELIGYVQRLTGYCLTGSNAEQAFFIFHGLGQNGKSTYINVVSAVLGDYYCNAPVETFLRTKGDRIREGLANIAGARMVGAMEANGARSFDEELLKHFTGGDEISAERKYEHSFKFTPTAKIIFGVNHLPKIAGQDHGIWRRVQTVPWLVQISEDRKIKDYHKQLLMEREGIFAWAIEGCIEWQKNGLMPPKAVTDMVETYRQDMDPLAEFLSAEVVVGTHLKIGAKKLYEAYSKWAENSDDGGGAKLSGTAFGKQIVDRIGRQNKYRDMHGNVYVGLTLKSAVSDDLYTKNADPVPDGGDFDEI